MQICIFRKIAALLLCVMFMISFTACNDNSSPVGTWVPTAAAWGGESVDVSEIGFAELTLEADGIAKLVTNGSSAESTWTYNNDKLIIDDMMCEYADGIITLNQYGIYIKFTKK